MRGFLVRCSQQMIIYKTFYFNIGEPWFNNLPLNARFLGSLFSTNDFIRHLGLLFEKLDTIIYHGIQGFLVHCSQQMIIY